MKKKIIILLLTIIFIGFVCKVYASVRSDIDDWLNNTFVAGLFCMEHSKKIPDNGGHNFTEMERYRIGFNKNGNNEGYFYAETYNVNSGKWTEQWNEKNDSWDKAPGLGYTAYFLKDRKVDGRLNEIPDNSTYFTKGLLNDLGQRKHRDPRQWILWYSAKAEGLSGHIFKFIQSITALKNDPIDGDRWDDKDQYLKKKTLDMVIAWDDECKDYNYFVTHYKAPQIKESSTDLTNVKDSKDSSKNKLGPFKATWYADEEGYKSFGDLTLQVIRNNGNTLGDSAWDIYQEGKKVSLKNLKQNTNFYIIVDSKYINNKDTGIVGGKVELKYTRQIYTGSCSRWDPHDAQQRVVYVLDNGTTTDDDVVSWKIPKEETTNQITNQITIVKKDADTDKELIGTDLSFALVKKEGDEYKACVVDTIDESTAKFKKLQDEPAGIRYKEVKDGITITGLPNGKYLLYEKCPNEFDKETWTDYMKTKYPHGSFPATLPGNGAYYFCQEIDLNNSKKEDRIKTYTIYNKSNPSPRKLTLQKQDEYGNPLKNVDVTFALVKVGDPLYYYSVDEMRETKKSSIPTTFTFQEEITIYDLEVGEYKLYEAKVPEGYDEEVWRKALNDKYGTDPGGIDKAQNWVYCGGFNIQEETSKIVTIENMRRTNW